MAVQMVAMMVDWMAATMAERRAALMAAAKADMMAVSWDLTMVGWKAGKLVGMMAV